MTVLRIAGVYSNKVIRRIHEQCVSLTVTLNTEVEVYAVFVEDRACRSKPRLFCHPDESMRMASFVPDEPYPKIICDADSLKSLYALVPLS
jgi:hypothetical protein